MSAAIASAVVEAAGASVPATKKLFTRVGVVVSAGLQPKIVKVRVPMPVWNDKLRKYFHHYQDHLTHDEKSACKAGDVVRIQPFMKHSKHKKHVVYEVISPFGTGERIPIETPEEREERMRLRREKKDEKKAVKKQKNIESKIAAKAQKALESQVDPKREEEEEVAASFASV